MANSKVTIHEDSSDQLPRIVRLRGINFPWMVTEKVLDAVKAYDVHDDDIWVASFPKAGTHWLTEIVYLILADGYEEKVNRDRDMLPIEFDFSQPQTSPEQPGPRSEPQYKIMEKWEAPRIIPTHLPEQFLPTQIHQGKGKVVYVRRNPKDGLLSEWHFVRPRKFDPLYDEWDYYFQQFLKGETIFGSWFDHVLNYCIKHRYDRNFLTLTYEDMKEDTKGAVIQIADFLGKHLSDDAIDRVVEFSSMKSMKARFHNAPSNSQTADRSAPSSTSAEEGVGKKKLGVPAIMRKGVIGDWKTKFTVAQNEAFDALYKEKMAGSGLKVQFE